MLRVFDNQGARQEYYPAATRYLRQEFVYFQEPIGKLQNKGGGPVFDYMVRLSVWRGQKEDRKVRFLRRTDGLMPSLYMFDERAWWQLAAKDKSVEEIRERGLGKVVERGVGHAAILGSESGLYPFEVISAVIGITGEVKVQDHTVDGVDIRARWPEFIAVNPGDSVPLISSDARLLQYPEKRLS